MARPVRLIVMSIAAFVVIGVGNASAGVLADFTFALGGTWPQGDYTHYGVPGWHGFGRLTVQIPRIRAIMGWAEFSLTEFGTSRRNVEISQPPGHALQLSSQKCYAFRLGVQAGNYTRHGFFRPHAGIGVGTYFFASTTSLQEDPFFEEDGETIDFKYDDSHLEPGLGAHIGADFFFTPTVGATVEFVYDHVVGLNVREGDTDAEADARFQGFVVGVTVALERIRDQ